MCYLFPQGYLGGIWDGILSVPEKSLAYFVCIKYFIGSFMDPGEKEDIPDKDISLREYQKELAEPALRGENVLIVAPTGSGKTRVALKIIQVVLVC